MNNARSLLIDARCPNTAAEKDGRCQRDNGLDLEGGRSNHNVPDLLQCLTGPGSDQVRSPRKRSGWPDGRRRFGTVSNAIVAVLSQKHEEMAVKDIRNEVEQLLGSRVSRFSLSDYLLTRSRGVNPLFEANPLRPLPTPSMKTLRRRIRTDGETGEHGPTIVAGLVLALNPHKLVGPPSSTIGTDSYALPGTAPMQRI